VSPLRDGAPDAAATTGIRSNTNHELFGSMRARGPVRVPNPNGIPSSSPGLARSAYPGIRDQNLINPNGVASAGGRC
jgi:hypothetical protein